jgi:hypothetical protein
LITFCEYFAFFRFFCFRRRRAEALKKISIHAIQREREGEGGKGGVS